ncbi:MDR family MFS transporter [Actinomyces ruminicola]|uniref:Drug resistance transporter, EmrB/QacA subfamily n=1 Tax=Actinomyces ruminicola TaxID=332524 RepID=A0A1G9XUG8_9ACTO|nr:MDR family MFS transporter [Actinomyces ruminicola]SDN00447.1 drug resistance transporter, EmrB/QacA subfamily [Actinomyces ruminicola]
MSSSPTPGAAASEHADAQAISGAVEGMTFRPDRRFWVVYICLMTVQFLTAMYHTVVATALPTVIGDLGGVAHMSWAITAYTLGQTLAMPINGKLGDLVGRKQLYLLAIALFVGGSALCGLATDMFEFTVFRFVQGLGGGGLMICSQAITGDIIPPRVRGTYMAPMGAMFGIAAILGPLLGGWLSDWLGWRWIFWFFLPFGLFAWVAVAIALRMPRRSSSFSIDWAGLALTSIGAAGIVLIATWGGSTYAWNSPVTLGLIGVTLASWAAVVPVERRAADPILPLQVLTNHTFIIATVVSVLMAACMFGMNGYLPTYLQMVHGVSATMSGLLLVPGSVGMFTGSLLSGMLVTRTGRYKPFPIMGSLLAASGMAMLGVLPADAHVAWTGVAVFILEIGIGMFLQLSVLVIQNALPASMLGTATSTNNFFREIGVSIGNTIVGVLFTGRLTASLLALGFDSQKAASITPAFARSLNAATGAAVIDAYHHALAPVLLSLAPVLLLAAAIAVLFRPIPLSTKTGLEQLEEELAEEGAGSACRTEHSDG